MSLTPKEQELDIEQMLDRIEEIIANGELPKGLAGALMSQSLEEFHQRLSNRLEALQTLLKK